MANGAHAVDRLVGRIKPLLAGQPPELVGAALADLLAIWLASHVFIDMPDTTDAMREALLVAHIDKVRELIPVNAAMLGTASASPSCSVATSRRRRRSAAAR